MADRDQSADSALESVFWRDEILQVMYWMSGEGLARECSEADLKRFLKADSATLEQAMAEMVSSGLLDLVNERLFVLTARGKAEGARRFADEFDDMLKPGHFECDEPDCECHSADSLEPCKHLHPTTSVAEGHLN
jgi:hypothetical protein